MSTDIGQMIADLQRRMQKVEAQSRLKSASLDDTALLVRDGTGSLRAVVGQQGDGTTAVNVVNGAPPPAPSTPTAAPALGGVSAGWDGLFADGAIIPLDWARVEVHASPDAGFTPTTDTLIATIETAQGGIVYIPATAPQHVRLLARNTSGAPSDPTAQVGPYAPKPVAGEIGIGEITETLIADGAVTTPKVYANAITTALLAAGSVDATALKADAITGKTITGGTITGADIIGGTVTGGTLRTGTVNERVVITPTPAAPLVQRASVLLYSGAADEIGPGVLNSGVTSSVPSVILASPCVATDSASAQVRSTLALIPPKPGSYGGKFVLTAHNPGGNSQVGRASIEATTATTAAGPAQMVLHAGDGATTPKTAEVQLGTGVVKVLAEALQVTPAATAASGFFLNSAVGHTGNMIRTQQNSVDRFVVDNAGNGNFAGNVDTAGNLTAGGTITGANVTTAGALTAANVKAGRVNITPTAANTPTSATVTGLNIPAGLTPRAVACASSGAPGTSVLGVSTTNVTTSSMLVWLTRNNTTATGVDWQVIGV
ncbi:hypothetical protein DBP19_36300 [Streptomyces sp. CS090A]|uniref:hypothetical protein n=1 Tax=Streptomyces sp. CS090A TaxID=2162710 RepID=UPI000D51900B|nr:hypothetical protein [Streptomyces sp. CS090A]PVC80602.1 hypothetical protein DBP19_36300 [Streptomyces sp. CS090A]